MTRKKREKLLILNPSCEGWPEWPVGMAYVLASMEDNDIPFDFIDTARVDNWETAMLDYLAKEKYLMVASGGLLGDYKFFRRIVELVEQHTPDTFFLLGGNITKDGNDELLFDVIGADFCILGEAETAMPVFVKALRDGERDFGGYDGVIFRNEKTGEVVRNRFRRLDLKENRVRPAWHHFDTDFYIRNSSFPFMGKGLRSMPVLSGRGCVGKCGFCSPTIGGFRQRSIDDVMDEIQDMAEQFDFDKFCFLNEMFYPRAKEVREFCRAYMQLGLQKPWFVQVRVDSNLDVDTIKLMKEAGCIVISAGIESGSDDVLAAMNKKTTADQIRTFFRNCREAGMPSNGTFIIGYEGEREEDLRQTIDMLIEEDISSADAMLFAYQGTPVYRSALDKGVITDEQAHLDDAAYDVFGDDAFIKFRNLTAMTKARFFDVAPKEVRRYNTYVYDTYRVRDIQHDLSGNWRWLSGRLSGKCRCCGADVRDDYVVAGGGFMGILGIGMSRNTFCGECYKPISFSLYDDPKLVAEKKHLRDVAQKIRQYSKVVVCGSRNDLNHLLRIDFVGLDYDSILGVHLFGAENGVNYLLKYPVLTTEALASSGADCILCLDFAGQVKAIEKAFADQGVTVPEMLNVCTDDFRNYVKRHMPVVYWANAVSRRLFGGSLRSVLNRLKGMVGR